MSLDKHKQTGISAAKKAGKILLKYFDKGLKPDIKSNDSFVSKADIEANNIIIKEIKKNFPGHAILTEESGSNSKKSDYKWVIDPLDGTHNFLRGIPIFGVSIALQHKDKIILGVLNFPVLKTLVVAEKGKGAFANGKKLKVTKQSKMEHSFINIEFSTEKRTQKINFFRKVSKINFDMRNFGSAIYTCYLLASGKVDGYVVLTSNIWDVAAGFLIIEEAGGRITDPKGKEWTVRGSQFIVSNGNLHRTLLRYSK